MGPPLNHAWNVKSNTDLSSEAESQESLKRKISREIDESFSISKFLNGSWHCNNQNFEFLDTRYFADAEVERFGSKVKFSGRIRDSKGTPPNFTIFCTVDASDNELWLPLTQDEPIFPIEIRQTADDTAVFKDAFGTVTMQIAHRANSPNLHK